MNTSSSQASAPRGPARWLSPWMIAYAMVGMLLLGVGPILIPVTVAGTASGSAAATAVGVVVAAFYVGGLLAPAVGTWADRHGRQRTLFLACLPVMAAAVLGFAFVEGTLWWALLAFVFGGVGAIAGTLAAMFVVEPSPPSEWNVRISWFRFVYGAGQVIGLVIAAVAAAHAQIGWLVAGVLLLAGSFAAAWRLPKLKPVPTAPEPAPEQRPEHAGRAIGVGGWLPHLAHRPSLRGLTHGMPWPFALMLVVWFLTMMGVQTFFNVVPLIMSAAFSVNASVSSTLFLVGAGIGTLVYPVSGRLATRRGPAFVFVIGVVLMLASFTAMSVVSALKVTSGAVIGSVALVVAAIAYSFLVVAATMLLAALSPAGQGEAMGLLNAIIAIGAVVGAIVPSFIAAALGYDALPAVAAVTLALAFVAFIPLIRAHVARP
ncbi:MFS transporter [Microbacterium koreense]|uniref:MFS transporter n=1 Tax=Microbacterium koreense TaxID=323761 RepID=A0ABW2ZRF5_9MICO